MQLLSIKLDILNNSYQPPYYPLSISLCLAHHLTLWIRTEQASLPSDTFSHERGSEISSKNTEHSNFLQPS